MANKDLFLNRGPSKPKLERTLFDWSFNAHASYKEGYVYPCYLQEVPSDTTVVIKPSFAFDFHPMVFPIQNNVRVHQSFYKIPWRLLWDNFEDWYTGVDEHEFPYLALPPEAFKTGGMLDHLGVPTVIAKPTTLRRSYTLNNGMRIGSSFFKGTYLFEDGETVQVSDLNDLVYPGLNTVSGTRSCMLSPVLQEKVVGNVLYGEYVNPKNDSVNRTSSYGFEVFIVTEESSALQTGATRFTVRPFKQFRAAYNGTVATSSRPFVIGARGTVPSHPLSHAMSFYFSDSEMQLLNDFISSRNTYLYFVGVGYIAARISDDELIRGASFYGSALKPAEEGQAVEISSFYSVPGFGASLSFDSELVLTDNDTRNNFAVIDGAAPNIPISALPLRAMEFLKNYVFRNAQIDPFILNGKPTYNKFLTNSSDGADSTTPYDLFKAPYEFDKFTTCLKTPQLGRAPLVGVSVSSAADEVTMTFRPAEGSEYTVGVQINEEGNAVGISNYEEVADKPNIHRLEEFIAAGISINDLRQTSCFQRYLERMQNTSQMYEHVVQEFFGVRPPTGDHFPEYLGGVTRDVLVSKIQNVAKSEGNPLGDFAGTANVSGHGESFECFCSEQSYIIGVIWFSVTPVYSQMLPRHYTKMHRLDLYNPQFATIPPQPIYKYELNALALRDNFNAIFGYNTPFIDLKTRQDEVHGEFRTSMYNFIQQRFFPNAPELGRDFIYIDPDELADVFAVSSDTDKVYGIMHFDVIAEAPIPKISIPKIVG